MARWLITAGLGLSMCAWLGCSSFSPSQYVAPRVTGRVLDMETHQPLENVQVRRTDSDAASRSAEPYKGARALDPSGAVRTRSDGHFDLPSERTLGVFRGYGWYSISVAFEHGGYQSVLRSYTLANSTNTSSGEPLVPAGDILLPRLKK